MGVGTTARLVRTDRGRRVQGSMEVTEYQPVSSFTVVSRFGSFTLHARATLAPVAPACTRLELVIDTHARGAIRLLLPLMRGPSARRWPGAFAFQRSSWKRPRRPRPDPLGAQRDPLHAMQFRVAMPPQVKGRRPA
jgi:hypothetical protein